MKKIQTILILFLLILMFYHGSLIVQTTLNSMEKVVFQLIPSLFLSLVLIRFIDQMQLLQRFRYRFLSWLFHMEEKAVPYVLYSMVLGFPSSASFISQAYKENILSKEGALRLFYTCSFASPAFIVLTCGTVFYNSFSIGLQLLFCHICSGLTLLLFTRKTKICVFPSFSSSTPSFPSAISSSILASGKTLFLIGGYYTLFACIIALIDQYLPLPLFFQIIVEFSNGLLQISLSQYTLLLKLLQSSFLLGFGGFCVHMQVVGMCETLPYNYYSYFFFRILQGLLASLYLLLFIQFFS